MGEYAIRKSDNQRVKMGTCEEMYYLRYEDREKVRPEPGSVDPVKYATELRFRLPFPDEDAVRIGEYDPYSRGAILHSYQNASERPGSFQLSHPSGLLLSVPCYHGLKLPDVAEGMRAHWNGKDHALQLISLRPTLEGVKPVIACRWCREQWRGVWSEIWEFVPEDLQPRLEAYRRTEVEHALKAVQDLNQAAGRV